MSNPVNTILHGDAASTLKTLPDNYVQCVVTSPPYYGLRDYGVDGQIGLEETPQLYITRLVDVFREVRRVLTADGTLWLNVGDSYAGSGKGSGGKQEYLYESIPRNTANVPHGFKTKDLMMIPARLAIALCDDGWWLRSDIVWHKSNPMPESCTDRPTKAHEYIFLLAKSEHYYYNADAIREPHADVPHIRGAKKGRDCDNKAKIAGAGWTTFADGSVKPTFHNPLGRNKRSVWPIASQPLPMAHFATMPPKLVEPCIMAGSRPGDIILDPFMGAGTVALVALQHQRQYLGIELNADYIRLANERIAVVQPRLWTGSEVAV